MGALVKDPLWLDYSEVVSETASRAGLYLEHEIKQELVVGPETIQPPDILQPIATEKHIEVPRKMKKKCNVKGATRDPGLKKYICEICNQYFDHQKQLRKHKCTDYEEKLQCLVCNKQFKLKSSLKSHKWVHISRKPFSCRFCQKSFKRKGTMTTHERTHTGDKPYSCEICNRDFTQQTSLNNHKLLHEGIKPYPCPNCPDKFTQLSNLRQHLSRFHPEIDAPEIVSSSYLSKKKDTQHGKPVVLKFKTYF